MWRATFDRFDVIACSTDPSAALARLFELAAERDDGRGKVWMLQALAATPSPEGPPSS